MRDKTGGSGGGSGSGPATPPSEEAAPGARGPAGSANQTLALAAMMFAVAMTFIDQTIVAIAAPDITDELGLTASGMRWVVNSYLLALAACFALGGRLADIHGHRTVMLIGTLVFVIASVLCGCVPASGFAQTWMIIFRAVQGAGAALMFPAALAVVTAVFPVERRGRAIALFFGVSGGLTAIGPLLGGVLTAWTWRAIFWVNVPVAVIAIVLTVLARIPDDARRERLDLPGAFLVAAGMGLSVLGLQQASSWGWGSLATWGCVIGGLLLLIAFCVYELRVPEQPLIKLRVFRDRAFSVDTAVLFFGMLAFVPLFFFASVYAQVSLRKTPNEAALYLLYFFLGFVLASQVGGRMLDKRGARPPLLLGTALATAGFALWAAKLTDLSYGAQWPYVVLSGAGIGLLLAPASTDSVNRAIDASYGEVTGITQTARNYAAAVGLAVYGTVLSHVTVDKVTATLHAQGLPRDEARRTAHDIAQSVAGHGDGRGTGDGSVTSAMRETGDAVRMDFAEANQWVFYGMAIALALAFLCALAHPGTRVTSAAPDPGPAER
ncbi:MFS transporter [Streptomyces sp. NPDC020141]|uniref:MFS transporter n=1 Tax=Streptomyces sp. NPDC020141 TaxID=3365065 RepID=UPI00379DA27F